MQLLLSHAVLGFLVGVTGFIAGVWLRGWRQAKHPIGDGIRLVPELISSLHHISMRVAADVHEHSHSLDESTAKSVSGEMETLLAANRQVQSKLHDAEDTLGRLSDRIERHATEARTDVLTGLANRRAYEEEAIRCYADCLNTDRPLSLVMIDIDEFKQVNNTFGHLTGDEVLREMGMMIRDHFRHGDVATRYGGKKFAVLLPFTAIAQARGLADGVRKEIEKICLDSNGSSVRITVSAGVAELQPDEDPHQMLKRADQAVYAAKHAGRNRVHWHDGMLPHPYRSPELVTA